MKTIPIKGTSQSITFLEDDTIEVVRQWTALAVGSHPDRLFLMVKGKFPGDYYSSNPKRWTDLFHRLSYDGKVIPIKVLENYVHNIRAVNTTAQEVTLEEWESREEEFLKPIYHSDDDFEEYRILGVDEAKSFAMPIPPTDIPLQSARIPIPSVQSLFETFHSYEVVDIQAIEVEDSFSETIKLNYFPFMKPDTPPTIETLRPSLQANQTQIQKLLDLHVPAHEKLSVIRAKWYVPFISTHFTSPRARFEQMFYGLTVSKETPYIGYFTSKSETMRHKFYCEDPKTKQPLLDTSMLKGWLNASFPQRRRPTLLLYRGSTRGSFDRIAITPTDITFSIFRGKDSTETLGDMRDSLKRWFLTLDAIVPFVMLSDIADERWEIGETSALAQYAKEVREFDMHRFPCLRNVFGFQQDTFRFLRTENSSQELSPREIQAYQILNSDDSENSVEYLAKQMDISIAEANELFASIQSKAEDINVERAIRLYPTIKFTNKEVIVKFVSNLERTLHYVDILRFVLTTDSEEVDTVCPRRMEEIAPVAIIPQQEIDIEGDFERDDEFFALMGVEEEPAKEVQLQEAPTKTKKVAVGKATTRTYNYFPNLLQKFDPETFDKDSYPFECKKPRQVVVLTPEQKDKLGPEYNFENAPESQKLALTDPDGTALCPAFWCMKDEAPLRQDQLVLKDDGELHCPICDGKVRTGDTQDVSEYTVIDRSLGGLYPNYLKNVSKRNQKRVPCCFQVPRSTAEVITSKTEETYILSAYPLPGLRLGWLSSELAERIEMKTDYKETIKNNRLLVGKTDTFLVGLTRPSKTLPVLLNSKKKIPSPLDAKEETMRCSFFRTWTRMGNGTNITDRILDGINDAYEHGELSLLDEMEYVSNVLNCEVIRIDSKTQEVVCGFWSDTTIAKNRTTLVMVDDDLLCRVKRESKKYAYFPDIQNPLLHQLSQKACSVNLPTFSDAIAELQLKGKSQYQVILDPFKRIQALFVPKEIILPIVPYAQEPDQGIPVKTGYADISEDELPNGREARAFLSGTKHPGYKKISDHENLNGMIVEFGLASGFRIPIQAEEPDEPEEYATEVIDTIRRHDEKDLIDTQPNKADKKIAQEIAYQSEIYEFLLFSLAKDIQTEEYSSLRTAIETKQKDLPKLIQKWFQEEAYTDTTQSPIEFINKVRTPCGQYTEKDTCKKSSLCGWHKNTCKIKVKPILETKQILHRIAKTLITNDKQRALVLDNRVSPFFSTILYLEMPHELITTTL
jgi:hypothetical protein